MIKNENRSIITKIFYSNKHLIYKENDNMQITLINIYYIHKNLL